MPIREAECSDCGLVYEFVLLSTKKLDAWTADIDGGQYECAECGSTLTHKMSLPNIYSPPTGYPFVTPYHMLPPVIKEDGTTEFRREYISNRADLKRVLKKHGMVEVETESDHLTSHGGFHETVAENLRKQREKAAELSDSVIEEDMKLYNHYLSNPTLRRTAIKDAVDRRKAL